MWGAWVEAQWNALVAAVTAAPSHWLVAGVIAVGGLLFALISQIKGVVEGVQTVVGWVRDRRKLREKRGAMDAYLETVRGELERIPWALEAPDRANRTSQLVVESTVAEDGARTLAQVHERTPNGRFVLLGDPGCGKTMALKRHGLWCLDNGLTPIYLRAKQLEPTVEGTLRADPASAEVVDPLLDRVREGRAVLLVDSIDEVDRPDEKRDVRVWLAKVRADPMWSRCPIFAASRSVGYDPMEKYTELRVLPLDERGMVDLLRRWEVPEAQIDEIVRERQQPNGRLASMTQSPLHVTLMAIVLRERGDRPTNWSRTSLYRASIDRLLSGTHKRREGTSAAYLHGPLALEVLAAHALHTHGTERRDTFTARDIEQASPAQVAQLRACAPDRKVEGFLTDLAEKTGILTSEGRGRFGFPHRTFAEYLAATELARRYAAGTGEADLQRVLDTATWDAAAEAAAWRPFCEKYDLRADLTESQKESLRAYEQALEFTLRPEHEATTAEVVALAHGVLSADQPDVAGQLLDAVLDRSLAPHLVSRIGRALDQLDVATAHRLLDAIPGAPHWALRQELLLDLPQLLGDPARALALCEGRRERVTHGADLFWLHQLGTWLGDGTIAALPEATRWAERFWSRHRPDERAHVVAALVWVEVDGGSFRLGTPEGEEGDDDERPQHEVVVTAPFALLDAPVTNALYERFDPRHAADRQPEWDDDPDQHPVYNLTWYEAAAFAAWVAAGERGRVRLPSEVEWERAARLTVDEAHTPRAKLAWYRDNSERRTHPVRHKPDPDGFRAGAPRVYDLLGNVWEWCADRWSHYDPQPAHAPRDHDPWTWTPDPLQLREPSGARRVVRGGSWNVPADRVRVGYRDGVIPGFRVNVRGFRLVRVLSPQPRPDLDGRP